MKEARDTLYSMLLGIIISGVLIGILGTLLYAGSRVPFALGVCLGVLAAVGIAFHLYYTIDRALDMEAEAAVSYTRRMALLRMIGMGIPVVVAVLFPTYFHVLGVFLGELTLKIGAFLSNTGWLSGLYRDRK